ncbi:hypothetical protein CONPUDRAFT_138627 [Coniophora puteana RWD-64-598 SS2]|uniref:MYND-type domain-containing protein n=1 Tax=Coniophora puteana (strain RWD-64-598) TaxID=741705 RepID=A0A5M3MI15_CONPW|nr:uncharacterized protein CONPUDRAFT_138627 [Coniophora puteana RWD-64-598 SS2]EIW78285.1 hypothetical protein CONPUDRAFT_138627 [Coniophora puteana RWD-64-598 SS2]
MEQDGTLLGRLHLGLAYQNRFNNLFRFAGYCRPDTVPLDILPQCMWALRWLSQAAEEASEGQLRGCKNLLPKQTGALLGLARYGLIVNCEDKLIKHLLGAPVDRPKESLVHFQRMFDFHLRYGRKDTTNFDMLSHDPDTYAEHGVALARTLENDEEAECVLRKTLAAFEKPGDQAPRTLYAITCRVYLARVLRRRGVGGDAESQYLEAHVAKWLKKNRFQFSASELRDLFGTSDTDSSTDPILLAIGGVEALKRRGLSFKSLQRTTRRCQQCSKGDPAVKLFQCSKCRYTFYCSKACQRGHWPLHKQFCAEHTQTLMLADQLKASGDIENSQLMSDWITWRNMEFPGEMKSARVNALKLRRDPSRGRSHIIMTEVRRVASSKHPARRFEAVKMGVFCLADVKRDRPLTGPSGEEIEQMMDEMLKEYDHGRGPAKYSYPWFEMYFSADNRIPSTLTISVITITELREIPYDPDWRKHANYTGVVPQPLSVLNWRATDAENDIEC